MENRLPSSPLRDPFYAPTRCRPKPAMASACPARGRLLGQISRRLALQARLTRLV
jgi:hypothetical protein